ncbi:MAG: zinc transporter ZntB [Alphaproteobacteria bacterium]|nr:zinc transporter ZntB [Alphaproteobacteria bacterium]
MTEYSKDSILLSYAFDGMGGATALDKKDVSKYLEADSLAWVHMRSDHSDTRPWLEKELEYLDDIVLDALLADETRPRIMEHRDGVLMILRGVNLNENADPEDMVSIRVWVDPHRIVSLRRRRLRAVGDVEERLLQGLGPKNSGDFITELCSRMFERMEPVLHDLDERTDNVEEQVMEEPNTELRHDIIDIRKQAIMMRRYISPQREVLAGLRASTLPWLTNEHKRQLQESLDRLTRYVEDLDAIRERAQVVKDELANVLADKLNRNMYLLSVIAAIFLPLGFLTGLLGINVGGIPGADDTNAFWIFIAMLVAIIMAQIAWFKRMGWF